MAVVAPAPPRLQDESDVQHTADERDDASSFRLTGAARRMQVLLQTNALLDRLGFGARSFEDFDDLVASVSSMSVALYEKLFQFRLDGVVRVPTSAADYAHNAQLVVDALSGALLDEDFDAAQLTGESLCAGDVDSISQLVHMLQHIHDVLYADAGDDGALAQSKTDPNTNGSRAGARKDDASLLLTTQKYGRFVPVGAPDNEDPDDSDDLAAPGLTHGGPTYFGDVSSVSGASGSEASVHFMEEEGEFARAFSEMPSHSSPATSKESPGGPEAENGAAEANEPASAVYDTPTRSKNQEEADGEERDQEDEDTSSPVKKKHAISVVATIAPKGETTKKKRKEKKNATPAALDPLYPLLPETTRRSRVAKSQTEFQRYKLQLKSHLQQLRHVRDVFGLFAGFYIRTQRFTQDLRLHRLALGLATQRAEERQLQDAMQHLLHLEREKLRDEHRSTTQALRQLQRDHAERERALESYYSSQLELVREQTQRELSERQIVEKAHRQASAQMLKELRQDRERQLVATLEQRRHLEEVRRVRRATWLDQALEEKQATSQQRQDAFYIAAMKARGLRQRGASTANAREAAVGPRRR
ncbi:hypothetical protein P43SY_007076 [Pythium insidiosum]|uniref:DUF5745 domain-containing protein n=1 Tax=Pythium insidiosum TaxID=114742 RepID=A0AAD5Q9A3_PYTIN|nr:hypothetical protein P43SY_007076 [Pythium insidiosum]